MATDNIPVMLKTTVIFVPFYFILLILISSMKSIWKKKYFNISKITIIIKMKMFSLS